MGNRSSRRSLLAGVLCGGCFFGLGGYTWQQYTTRNTLRFRPLEMVNHSDHVVEPVVTVLTGRTQVAEPRYDTLAPAVDAPDNRASIPGRWIKSAQEYALRAELGDERLYLSNSEIIAELPDGGWGTERVRATIHVSEQQALSAEISPS